MHTVLIVDDYPAARKALRNLLENQCSAVCIEAINGLDGIVKAKKSRPDLIILDLGMPKNGFEAATVLHKTMPQVPIFMFTFHDIRDVESQAASVGIRAVFSKSTGIHALVTQTSALLKSSPTWRNECLTVFSKLDNSNG